MTEDNIGLWPPHLCSSGFGHGVWAASVAFVYPMNHTQRTVPESEPRLHIPQE